MGCCEGLLKNVDQKIPKTKLHLLHMEIQRLEGRTQKFQLKISKTKKYISRCCKKINFIKSQIFL